MASLCARRGEKRTGNLPDVWNYYMQLLVALEIRLSWETFTQAKQAGNSLPWLLGPGPHNAASRWGAAARRLHLPFPDFTSLNSGRNIKMVKRSLHWPYHVLR